MGVTKHLLAGMILQVGGDVIFFKKRITPCFGKMIQFDLRIFFQMDWFNHQPIYIDKYITYMEYRHDFDVTIFL